MTPQAVALATLRGVHVVALASLFGTLVSLALVAPAGLREAAPREAGLREAGAPREPDDPGPRAAAGPQQPFATAAVIVRRRLLRLALWSAGLAFLLGILWLLLETAAMAGAASLGGTLAALGTVLSDTRFGHLILIRLVLLVPTMALLATAQHRHARPGQPSGAMAAAPSRAVAAAGPSARTAAPSGANAAAGQGAPRRAAATASPAPRGGSAGLTLALLLAAAALGMQGFFGHAGATGGRTGLMLLVSETLHLLATGAWLGGLLPLLLLLRTLPPPAAAAACEQFSPIGLAAVLAIAATAAVQSFVLIGGWGGLFGTAYGRTALLKLGIFGLLLLLAAYNRGVLTGRLRGAAQAAAARAMRRSVAAETALGAVVIVLAAFLASGMPAVHAVPVWPFARRPSLQPLATAQAWAAAICALLPGLAAIILLAAVRARRRWRWPARACLLAGLALTAWRLEPLLTVPAYPTSYQTSPTAFAAASIMRGEALFLAHCALCHAAPAGTASAPSAAPTTTASATPASTASATAAAPSAIPSVRAAALSVPTAPRLPADLATSRAWTHPQGDLYWFIAHGTAAAHGVPAMQGFTTRLSPRQIWSLIDFLRAASAGDSLSATGGWARPPPLPQLDAVCADGSAINDAALRGRIVHIVAATHSIAPPPPPPGIRVATIVLPRTAAVKPLGTACVATTPAAWNAFALIFGLRPHALAGAQALADGTLRLRRLWRPGSRPDWNDPAVLSQAIRAVAAHPWPGKGG